MISTRQTPVGPLHDVSGEDSVDLGRICHAIVQVPANTSVSLGGALAHGPAVPMRDHLGAAVVFTAPGIYRTPTPTRYLTFNVVGDGPVLIQPE